MSPFGRLLLRVMRGGALASAIFIVLVILIEIWKRWQFGGFGTMQRPDFAFLGILAVMLVCCLWLARSISRELARD